MKFKVIYLWLLTLIAIGRQPLYGQTWKELLDRADSLSKFAKYDSAIVIGKSALEKAMAQFGESDTTVARILNSIGVYYYYKANYADAEPLYKRALAIREKALGPEHPDVAVSLNDLAALYWDQGKYADAEPLYKRALAIREKALGPEHPDVAVSLNDLAVLYRNQGKYAEAEPLYKRALAIREKALGPEHPDIGGSLSNLAVLYRRQGRYAEAEPLYKRALAILEKALGSEHPNVGRSLNNLAVLYREQGRYAEAEPLCKRALVIQEKALGSEHPSAAMSLNNLVIIYRQQGRYAEAEPLCKRALAIQEKALGSEHPNVAMSLDYLAVLYRDQGKYAESERLNKKALAIREKALGSEHPDVALSLENSSKLARLSGGASSLAEAGRAFQIRKKNFEDGSSVMSEKDALTYSGFMRSSANNYLSSYLDAKAADRSTVLTAGDVIFSTKGQVSDEIFARRKSQASEADSATSALAEAWRSLKFQLSNLYTQGPGKGKPEVYKGRIDSLSRTADSLEADLARHSESFRKEKDYRNVSTERVASLLPENSVLVEYLRWDYLRLNPDSSIPRYLVVVLGQEGKPIITDLGKASRIDSGITRYRKLMVKASEFPPSFNDTKDYAKTAQKLYALIWKPVEKFVSGKNLVLVAPDGGLNLVSFAGLVDEKGSYLIEKYPLHYLSSGRDLIRLQEKGMQSERLLALGDPDYNASPPSRLGRLAGKSRDSSFLSNAYASRNVRSGCERLRDTEVERLPGTKKEVERIAQLWKQKADVYLGVQASEESFKAHAAGHQVLHLATHGYFLQGECEPGSANRGLGRQESYVGENPLLLSGLLLAGANLHGQGADSAGAEDGILTAEEVTAMNLSGTKLVVLSACETGLGEVKQGEGVYGLRRAFQMAGARTVISALWKVPDEITAETMGELYSFNSKSLPERMRQLQLSQLQKLRKQGDPDHPYSWGAFIALGDWR